MPVGTIAAAKELTPVAYQPLYLAELTLPNAAGNPRTIYLSTHPLNSAEGGFQYNSTDYLGRIVNGELAASQALSDEGIDMPPTYTLEIADPDSQMYGEYEQPIGLKGAKLIVRFVFWNANTSEFSSDSLIRFVGTCDVPEVTEKTIKVTASSKMNMSNTMMPPIHVQPTCPWTFPTTKLQRQDAADNDSGDFTECGYSFDSTGGNARGNAQATTTLAGSITNLSTMFTVGAVTGTLPPTPFPINFGTDCAYVTNVVGSTWTVVRNAQGATAGSAGAGQQIDVPFAACNRTRGDCMARMGNEALVNIAPDGDITHDKSARQTGTFGGVVWSPPTSSVSRGYISGKWEQIINSNNEAKYGDLVPFCYGTTWVDPLILNTVGDANYTKMEVLCCYGEVGYVYDVIVNGVKIPHASGPLLTNVPNEIHNGNIGGGFWTAVNSGLRYGRLNDDTLYNQKGDPYGSLCVLEVVVPKQLATASSTPRVQVRLDGPKVRVYTDAVTYTRQFTSNPVWHILDVMFWAGWKPAEIDLASWVATAAKADAQISFTNMFGVNTNVLPNERAGGGTIAYAKYAVSFSLRQRRSAAEIVRGLRNACASLIVPNTENGLVQIMMKETLSSQQPSAVQLNGVNASNYNTGISGYLVDGTTTANGFVAYDFNETNIARKDGSDESTLRLVPRTIQQSPNTIAVTFQNAENQYSFDSLTKIDTEDTVRTGISAPGNFPIDGVNTFDRAQRVTALFQAETFRGNARLSNDGQVIGDTGGTSVVEWETSFRAIHLKLGQIVRLSYQQRGIANWLLRITKMQPGRNGRIKLTAQYHNDVWYFTQFGQTNAPLFRSGYRNLTQRPPAPWGPNAIGPVPGDSMYLATDRTFNMAPTFDTSPDGSALAKIQASGANIVNVPTGDVDAPFVNSQATTSGSGGTIVGGKTLFFAVCAKDTTGAQYRLSGPSQVARTFIPAGTTNTATVSIPYWAPGSVGYVLFAGENPNHLTYQASADSTPATITLAAYNSTFWAMPDVQYDHLDPKVKRSLHSGVMVVPVGTVTSTTITLSMTGAQAAAMPDFAGYDVSVLGLAVVGDPGASLPTPIPVFNASIASSTGAVLTLATGLDGTTIPDPTAVPRGDGTFGLIAGDMVAIRTLPVVGSDASGNYVEDAFWLNPLVPAGLTVNLEIGRILRFIAGTGRGQTVRIKSNTNQRIYIDGDWPITPDATSRFLIEEPVWQVAQNSGAVSNSDPNATIALTIDMQNFKRQTCVVEVLTADAGSNESIEALSPVRDFFQYGSVGTAVQLPIVSVSTDTTLQPIAQIVQIDATNPLTITMAPMDQWIGLDITFTVVTGDPTNATIAAFAGDTFSGLTSRGFSQLFESVTITSIG